MPPRMAGALGVSPQRAAKRRCAQALVPALWACRRYRLRLPSLSAQRGTMQKRRGIDADGSERWRPGRKAMLMQCHQTSGDTSLTRKQCANTISFTHCATIAFKCSHRRGFRAIIRRRDRHRAMWLLMSRTRSCVKAAGIVAKPLHQRNRRCSRGYLSVQDDDIRCNMCCFLSCIWSCESVFIAAKFSGSLVRPSGGLRSFTRFTLRRSGYVPA